MQGGVLTVTGFDVKYCINDADTTIVEKSLDILNWNNMVLIADDTDISVLLITQLKGDLGQHCPDLKQQVGERMVNISSLINCIPDEKKNTLPLNHAMSGCDTTSPLLFGHGKTKLYKKGVIEKHPELSDVVFGGGGVCIFCPGTMTTHAESINSDLLRGLDRRLRHTQH